MESTEKEFIIDYHQTCIHLLNHEWDQAAEIIAAYVQLTSSNPKRYEIPVKQSLIPLLQSLPGGGFPGLKSFRAYIKQLRNYLDNDRLIDPTFKLN